MVDNHGLVSHLLAKGVYKLSPRRKGKSFMWSILAEILKEDGSPIEGLVYCRTCRKLLKFVDKQTSNLCRHKCCLALKQPQVLKTVSIDDKQEALNACTGWIIKDCRPFSSVSGTGFMKMVKFFIKIGSVYGENVDISDMLPESTTVARHVQTVAEEKKLSISDEIRGVVSEGRATATIDMWPEHYIKRNLLAVTLHYVKDFKLFDIILGIKSMDFQNSSVDIIRHKLTTLFKLYGVEDIAPITFVTNSSATNLVDALQNNRRLNCSSHLFAQVLEKSFEEASELKEILQACKKLVQFFKKADLQQRLSTPLKSPLPGCCNSNYTMLKSIVDNWDSIIEMLTEAKEIKQLLHLNHSTLSALAELCKNFDIVCKKLRVYNSPSLCYVLPAIYKIKNICFVDFADLPVISTLKENINRNITKIWECNLSTWHKAAYFLFPPAIASKQQTDIDSIKEFCVTQIQNIPCDTATSSTLKISSVHGNDMEFIKCENLSPSSRNSSPTVDNAPSNEDDTEFFFGNLIKNTEPNSYNSARDEVERYSNEIVPLTDDFQLFKWWKSNENKYPRLYKLALQILSVPASCAAAERAQPLAANIITDKLNNLGPKSIDNLLFLHSLHENCEI